MSMQCSQFKTETRDCKPTVTELQETSNAESESIVERLASGRHINTEA